MTEDKQTSLDEILNGVEEIEPSVSYKVPSHDGTHYHIVESAGQGKYCCRRFDGKPCEYRGADVCHHILRVRLLKLHVAKQDLEDRIQHRMTEVDFEGFVQKTNKIVDNVRTVLNHHEETRNSDLSLAVTYWTLFDGLKTEEGFLHIPRNLHRLTDYGTISRARRFLRHEYPPTDPEVARKRKQLEDYNRSYWRSGADM